MFSAPSMVNSFRLGYGQSIVKNPGLAALLPAVLDTQFGMTSSLSAPGISPQAGGEGLAGITSFGGFNKAGGLSDWVHTYQVFDDATRTFGNHSVKFGFMFLRNHHRSGQRKRKRQRILPGSAEFSPEYHCHDQDAHESALHCRKHETYNRNSVVGGYIQDDWKMRSNLTVNLGCAMKCQRFRSRSIGIPDPADALGADPGGCVADINGLPIDSTCTAP